MDFVVCVCFLLKINKHESKMLKIDENNKASSWRKTENVKSHLHSQQQKLIWIKKQKLSFVSFKKLWSLGIAIKFETTANNIKQLANVFILPTIGRKMYFNSIPEYLNFFKAHLEIKSSK